MVQSLHGVLPIVHTPFKQSGEIDWESLQVEIDWAFSVGADGMGTGMVSEILKLSWEERVGLTKKIVEFAANRGPIFAAVSSESGEEALRYARVAEECGCDAVMAAPPVNRKLVIADFLEYYTTIAEGISIPVIVQDASGYLGQMIPLEVYSILLERYGPERIVFKPEASPIGPNLSKLRDATKGTAKIFEGSGGILLVDSHRRGIRGTMPGMDLLDGIVELWRALEANDDQRAYAIYFPICSIVALQMQAGLDGFLAIEKYLMVKRGIFKSDLRRKPYNWELDPETATEVDRLYDLMQQVLGKTVSK